MITRLNIRLLTITHRGMLKTSGLNGIPATVSMLQTLATTRGNVVSVERKEIRSGITYRTWFVRPRGVKTSNTKMPTVNTATTLVISPCLARTCIKQAPGRIILPQRSAVQGCSTMGEGNGERHGLRTRSHMGSRTVRVDPCFAGTESQHRYGCGRRVHQTGEHTGGGKHRIRSRPQSFGSSGNGTSPTTG